VIAGHMLELSREINFRKGEILALSLTGNVCLNIGNYPRALEVYFEALKISEEIQDNGNIGRALSALADVYFYQGDIKRSLDYSHQSLAILLKLNDSDIINTNLINMGDTYEKSNQLDSALVYTRHAYLIALLRNDIDSRSVCLNNLGNVFFKLGKFDSSMNYYKSAIPLFEQLNNDPGFCEASLGMAKIYLREKKTDSCLYYSKLSFAIAKDGGFLEQVLAAGNFLAEYYKSLGNVDSAYVYQSATVVVKDSLFSQQKTNQIQNMTYNESMRRQQIEEAKEQERIRIRQNALMGVLTTLLIVAFLLYINNRQKRKANLQLQKQKEEIDQKAHELSVQKENLQQAYNNVEQLGEIGRKITSSLSVENIISTVYDNVNALMDASVFGIGIYEEDTRQIEFPATYENGLALPAYSNSIDDENRFAAICFLNGKEIVMSDIETEYKKYLENVPVPREGQLPVSLIYLPLKIKDKIRGVITVQSFQRNAYTDYQLYMLRNIANYAAIALENAEAYKKLNHTLDNLKKAQTQLIQSEKMASLGELTAGIAHEIQNPLNFVNNFSEICSEMIGEMKSELATGNLQPAAEIADNVQQNLEKILRHGKRADAIVKGMLQHTRTSTGQKVPTDINALADEYLRLSYHGLRAKDKSFNADFKTDFDESIGKINVVSQDIGRALLNLFNNAFYAVNEKLKASPHPLKGSKEYVPTVTIVTKKLNDKVEISVSDNGNGIPQNIVDKIFQPFFTTKPTGQGTGLGLSLAYDIIKAHRGEVKLETKEGEGSEFFVVLPV
jgi:signal transduction histidine kinase